MKKIVGWAERVIFPPVKIIHYISYGVLILLMFLTVGDIFGRKFAGIIPFFNPIKGTFELTEFALVVIVFASIGYTQITKGHISIDILTSRFSPRVQAILNSVVLLACMTVFALVAWQSFVYAGRLMDGKNESGVLKLQMYPFLMIVAIGSIIYCLTVLVDFLKSLARAVQHNAKAVKHDA